MSKEEIEKKRLKYGFCFIFFISYFLFYNTDNNKRRNYRRDRDSSTEIQRGRDISVEIQNKTHISAVKTQENGVGFDVKGASNESAAVDINPFVDDDFWDLNTFADSEEEST